MAQKTVLGKGLASLLPSLNSNSNIDPIDAGISTESSPPPGGASFRETLPSKQAKTGAKGPSTGEGTNKDRHPGISLANLDDIFANQLQPRRDFDDNALEELAQSIRSNGIIQPLIVRKTPGQDGFELIAGERRLRAAKLAGLKQVPIVIRRSTDRESLELALIENIQRQDLNCIDEALAYFQLIQDFTLTQEEIAERVGKDRATVANFLRLLRLPEAIIDDLKKGSLSLGHGKVLLSLDDAEERMRVRNAILEKNLSVRDTESLIQDIKKSKESKPSLPPEEGIPTPLAQRFYHLSQELTRKWSTKIEVKGSEKKGKIVIHYGSNQELDRILENFEAT